MPADIVYTELIPARRQELIVLMDDYGAVHRLKINVSQNATRAAKIEAAQQTLMASQAQLVTYAAANGHDLTSQKLSSVAEKTAKWNTLKPKAKT